MAPFSHCPLSRVFPSHPNQTRSCPGVGFTSRSRIASDHCNPNGLTYLGDRDPVAPSNRWSVVS